MRPPYARLGLAHRLTVKQCSAEDFEPEDGTYDILVCGCMGVGLLIQIRKHTGFGASYLLFGCLYSGYGRHRVCSWCVVALAGYPRTSHLNMIA